jgi:predicted AlkP superfamily phosphohydrolase/phosphomutase
MLPSYDWSQTRVFSLPSDQHGWIRVNLKGREAKGIVAVEQYDELCSQLEKGLRSLTTPEGKPLVCEVIRTAQ